MKKLFTIAVVALMMSSCNKQTTNSTFSSLVPNQPIEHFDIVLKDSSSSSIAYSFERNGETINTIIVNSERVFRDLKKNDVLSIVGTSSGIMKIELLIKKQVVCSKKDTSQVVLTYTVN